MKLSVLVGTILLSFLFPSLADAQWLADARPMTGIKPPESLYEGYREDRVHGYIPQSDIPDRYPIRLNGFVMPVKEVIVTSAYGKRWNRMHRGIDLQLECGDTVCTAFDGYVQTSGFDTGGYGSYLVVRHTNGLETVYGHLEKYLKAEGDEVRAGEPIALGGNSGRSTGPHLHFEALFMGQSIDPRQLIDFAAGTVQQATYYFTKDGRLTPRKQNKKREIRCHRVTEGETLSTIARKYAVTVDELCRFNHLKTGDRLRKGQVIRYN